MYVLLPTLVPASAPPSDPAFGFVNVHADPDGLVRRVFFRTTFPEFFGIPAGDRTTELLSLDARGLENAGLADRIPRTHKPVMFRFSEEILPRSLHSKSSSMRSGMLRLTMEGHSFGTKSSSSVTAQPSSEDRVQTAFGMKHGVEIHLNAINALP